ncbi:MAG: hypothetical protein GEV09_23400 [Pseudonocardiaceae bacterium]|nr:hypothetical protein [Pseudonocardiaceae bacterium]
MASSGTSMVQASVARCCFTGLPPCFHGRYGGPMGSGDLGFGVLGALEVRRNGASVPLPSARQRAVLAALLVRAGKPVHGDALIAAAWGDDLPAAPRAALHTLLSRLRVVVGADAVRSEPAGYRLAVERDQLDAARFEECCSRAAGVPAPEALGLLDTAQALCRGPAYAEFADRDFARVEAVRVDELRLAAVEDRAGLLLELGDADAAVAGLEPFVGEHPLRERARGLLMTALYRAGRVGDALDRYQDYRRHLADDLGLDPSPALRDLQGRILNHDLPGDTRRQPRVATPPPPWLVADAVFLGRDDDAAGLVEAVGRHRLVTVTGVGGVGKTRLVAEALPALIERLGLPATVVELGGVDVEHVELAIASALAIGPVRGDVGEAAQEYLSITPALLVLDNCEHVLTGVRAFVGAVLRRCPGVRIVATSRRRIGLAAEQVLPVEPLPTPTPDAAPAAAELTAAMRLFADRARRVRPAFALTAVGVPAVAEICRRLDGVPLAIELAATRAATLGVEPLRARLDQSLDLLGDNGDPGGRSLRAALDWSYGLLGDSEQVLLAAVGVFEGDFDLDGAERVAVGLGSRSVAAGLAELVDASLVATRSAAAGIRYRLLEIVRTFARERLTETGAERDVRLAHAQWARSMAESVSTATTGPGDSTAAARLDAEAASVRAAVSWALRTGEGLLAGQITGALGLGSVHRGMRLELVDVVRRAAEDPAVDATAVAPLARAAGALAAVWQGDLEFAQRAGQAALPAARNADDRFLALCALAVATLYRGEHDSSRRYWRELLAVGGPTARQVTGHTGLALVACYGGDVPGARRHAALATAAAEAAGSDAYRSFACYVDAEVAAADDPSTAVPLLREAARDADRAGASFAGGLATTALVAALTRLGRGAEALDVVGPLLERWLRLAVWPQLWTTLRILAELLADNDLPETAALLLAAADHAPSAPAVTGDDAERYRRLTRTLPDRVGARSHEQIAALAVMLPRAQVVDRAQAVVSELRAPSPQPAGPLAF